MIRKLGFGVVALLLAAGAVACSNGNKNKSPAAAGAGGMGGSAGAGGSAAGAGGSDAGTGGSDAGSAAVTVTPPSANVLTCSQLELTATVTGTANQAVTWSLDPAGSASGSIDTSGTYSAPKQTPAPDTVKVTATSQADTTATASSNLTLATVFPGTVGTLDPVGTTDVGVYEHQAVASGQRVYRAWGVSAQSGAVAELMVARSNDGGSTWATPVTAYSTNIPSGSGTMNSVAIAIDAGSPDVVYAVTELTPDTALATSVGTDGGISTVAFSVSKDGGQSFKTDVLLVSGASGEGDLADVISPAPGQVVVEAPGLEDGGGSPDLYIWTDASEGDGFATGTGDQYSYTANGFSGALANVYNNDNIHVDAGGGTDSSGGAWEAPKLFTDGNGRLCITYVGEVWGTPNGTPTNTYVQCSDDAGKTFSTEMKVDPATPTSVEHNQADGTLGPAKHAAVLWNQGGLSAGSNLYIATSTDAGQSFGAPTLVPTYKLPQSAYPNGDPTRAPSIAYDANGILWIAYRVWDGGFDSRVVVDKSCDDGATWSGPVLVNGPEGSITEMSVPALVMTSDPAPHLFSNEPGKSQAPFVYMPLAP